MKSGIFNRIFAKRPYRIAAAAVCFAFVMTFAGEGFDAVKASAASSVKAGDTNAGTNPYVVTIDLNSGAPRGAGFIPLRRQFTVDATGQALMLYMSGLKVGNADDLVDCLSANLDVLGDGKALKICDDSFCDAEKYDSEDFEHEYDALHCWAAAASNMLWMSGWTGRLDAGAPEFGSEDQVFWLFNDKFSNRGGDTDRGIDWFLTGEYFISGKRRAADLKMHDPADGFRKSFLSSLAQKQYDLSDDADDPDDDWRDIGKLTRTAPAAPGDPGGVSVFQGSIGTLDEGKFSGSLHAVTFAGIVTDPEESDPKKKYKALAVIDSDNDASPTDEEKAAVAAAGNAAQRKAKKEEIKAARVNSITFYPLECRTDAEGTTGWVIKGYGEAYAGDEDVASPSGDPDPGEPEEWGIDAIAELPLPTDGLISACTETAGSMAPFRDPDFTIEEAITTDDPNGVVDPYTGEDVIQEDAFLTGDPIYLNYFVSNRSYVDYSENAPGRPLEMTYEVYRDGSDFPFASGRNNVELPVISGITGGSKKPSILQINKSAAGATEEWPTGRYRIMIYINQNRSVPEAYFLNNIPKMIEFTVFPTKAQAKQAVEDAGQAVLEAEQAVRRAEQDADAQGTREAYQALSDARKALAEAVKTLDDAKEVLNGVDQYELRREIKNLEKEISDLEQKLFDAEYYKDITNYECRLSKTRFEYTGKKIKPSVKVKSLSKGDFTVKYKNNVKIGKATVTVTGVGEYKGKIVKHFRITKRTNRFRLRKKTKTFRAAALRKRAKSLRIKAVMPAKGAKGKVTYKVKLSAKAKKAVSFKAGKIKVKKGAKKGVYRLKVTAKAAGTRIYKRGSRTAILTIRIR